jgi:hypothetical protein
MNTRGRLAVYRQTIRLGAKPLEDHDQRFFLQLNTCGYNPYVTSSLRRGWVCLLWIRFAFVRCTYRTYCIGLQFGYGESGQFDKSDNLERRASHGVWEMSLRAEPHLYVSPLRIYASKHSRLERFGKSSSSEWLPTRTLWPTHTRYMLSGAWMKLQRAKWQN